MSHYFFDIVEGGDKTHDDVGREFAHAADARAEAARILIEVARDAIGNSEHMRLMIQVRNDVGHQQFVATLSIDLTDAL